MILDFSEINKDNIEIVGGKGANLGELTRANINVPKGFVLSAQMYRDFLKQNGLEEFFSQKLENVKEEEELYSVAYELREKIKNGRFSKEMEERIREKYASLGENVRVAVRSSATAEDLEDASFAGQQETYLNIQGEEDVIGKIICCYSSLWTDRAVSYRFHQGYPQSQVSIAVVIQEMVESEISGVLFTVNPVTKNSNEMQINASYGLGESVVSGKVTADSYIVEKNGTIREIHIGSKEMQIVYGKKQTKEVGVSEEKRKARALTDEEVLSLMRVGKEIEQHYQTPMDIEWAICNHIIYILQARAITTLQNDEKEQEVIQSYVSKIKLKKSTKDTMKFFLEKIPFAYRPLDFEYLSAINDQKAVIVSELGVIIPRIPQMNEEGIQVFPLDRIRLNKNIFRFFKKIKQMKDFDVCAKNCEIFMKNYQTEVERVKTLNFEEMDLQECQKFLGYSYDFTKRIAYDRFKYGLFPSVLASKSLTKLIQKVDKRYSAFDFYWNLENKTSVITEDILSMSKMIKKNEDLKNAILSGEKFVSLCATFEEFDTMTQNFLNEHGYRSDYNCYCLQGKTFWEDGDRLVNILRPMLTMEDSSEIEQKEFSVLMQKLKEIEGKNYSKWEQKIQFFRYFHIVREETQYMWECMFYYVRQCVRRVNDILLQSPDYNLGIANLFHAELMEAMERGFLNEEDREKIKRRNQNFPLANKIWDASKTVMFDTNGDVLKGVSGSSGIAVGKVCVIHSPKEFYKMKKGDVLVCHLTDPEWTPLFQLASAVVADTGAALSHVAIVAREYRIPAVLGVGIATKKWKDGDMIQVDGDQGEVKGC